MWHCKNKNFGTKPRKVFHLYFSHLIALWPGSHHLNSHIFYFLRSKMGEIAISNSLFCSENCLRKCMGKKLFILKSAVKNQISILFIHCFQINKGKYNCMSIEFSPSLFHPPFSIQTRCLMIYVLSMLMG